MRCHLVYSVPNVGSKTIRITRKVREFLQRAGLPVSVIGDHRSVKTDALPKSHPGSATKHLYEGFCSRIPTLLYHLSERVRCQFESDDIFLGHPMFPYSSGAKRVTELSIDQKPRSKVFALITPLHCNIEIRTRHINKEYLDSVDKLLPKADVLFAIMGKYWWDEWDSSPYAHWKKKMVRLDMAVDTRDFPRVKNRFNPPGKRGYLYIGRNDPMKGTDFLSELLLRLGSFRCGWIGSGPDIAGVPRISTPRPLTPEFMSQVAERFDFFITTGVADPNPTTILQSMSWGFPVICTPQSGYYETSYLRNVYHDNIEKSISILRDLQFADEDELIQMANEARRVVEKEYNWDRFVGTIFEKLGV